MREGDGLGELESAIARSFKAKPEEMNAALDATWEAYKKVCTSFVELQTDLWFFFNATETASRYRAKLEKIIGWDERVPVLASVPANTEQADA